MTKKKKLGEMLVENGLVDKTQLEAALIRQKQWGGRLGKHLVELNFTSEINLLKFLGKQLELPCADLSKIKITQETYSLISLDTANKYEVMPLQLKEADGKKFLFIGMSDPTSYEAIDGLRFATGCMIKPVIVTDSQLKSAINKYYVNSNTKIKPLTEKVPVIRQEDMQIVHEVPLKELASKKQKRKPEIEDPEMLALLTLLIEKEVITQTEFAKKLWQIKGGD